jgi:hypothetical protein
MIVGKYFILFFTFQWNFDILFLFVNFYFILEIFIENIILVIQFDDVTIN